ncbi:MAG: hypothetical protein KR126chlam3_01649 [Chlamydiae bacterium]|nr:hypothetical protein [Chlamydiota bacterium]
MNQSDYRNIENWMLATMEKYWAGQTWNQAIANAGLRDKLINPQAHGPDSIGKILIPEKCSICQGLIIGYFASRNEFNEGLRWNRSAACAACGHKPFATRCNCSPCAALYQAEKKRQKQAAQEKALLEKTERQEQIKNKVRDINKNVSPIEEIGSYSSEAILLALLVQSTSEDPFVITPIKDSKFSLAPSISKSFSAIQEVQPHLQFLVRP